ncbi:MAG TPA: tetratricopeptide repeat protein [Roseiarcus sp.]|nr:tetratricopeptide repeat protein [Roseiarcus sp.]
MAVDVFRSDHFVARARTGFAADACVVTFDSYSDTRTLERPGFGQHFFEHERIDAIHVIARWNNWYQHHDIFDVCKAVAAFAKGYRRVYTYGSSMGGYAAIRFGGLVHARAAIALSPQFSIDRSAARFEHRWTGDVERIDFSVEKRASANLAPLAHVCYDPFDLDRRHVELLRREVALIELPVRHGGHPVTGFMAEGGLLGEFVVSIVQERFDLDAMKSRTHAARKQSAQFWSVLAERARNPAAKKALPRRALSISPDDVVYHLKDARILALSKKFNESEAVFKKAIEKHPGNPVLRFNLSEMYEWRGDLREAKAAMEQIVDAHPNVHAYRSRLARLARKQRIQAALGYPIRTLGALWRSAPLVPGRWPGDAR